MRINPKGQCPVCLVKPMVYRRDNHYWCRKCRREFNLTTGEWQPNFSWIKPYTEKPHKTDCLCGDCPQPHPADCQCPDCTGIVEDLPPSPPTPERRKTKPKPPRRFPSSRILHIKDWE